MTQGAAAEPVDQPRFGHAQPCRAKTVAVARRRDRLRPPAFDQYQRGEDAAAGHGCDGAVADPPDPPVDRGAVSEHSIDMASDQRPVLGADIAPAAEIAGRGIVGRAPAILDFRENVDRGGDLRARGQGAAEGMAGKTSVPVAPAKAGFRDFRHGVAGPGFPLSRERPIIDVNDPPSSSALRGSSRCRGRDFRATRRR